MKRPRSVKWALGILLFGAVGFILINGWLIHVKGWAWFGQAYREEPWSAIEPLMRLVSATALLALGRKPFAYWTAGIALGLLCFTGFQYLYRLSTLVWKQGEASLQTLDLTLMPDLLVAAIFIFLLFYLFYRFTFGRPSRVYFRVIPPPADLPP